MFACKGFLVAYLYFEDTRFLQDFFMDLQYRCYCILLQCYRVLVIFLCTIMFLKTYLLCPTTLWGMGGIDLFVRSYVHINIVCASFTIKWVCIEFLHMIDHSV